MAKIFIIEDDKTIAALLQVALQYEGYEVRLETGADLFALDDTYDMILLDLTLPEADGLQLAPRIRGVHGCPSRTCGVPCPSHHRTQVHRGSPPLGLDYQERDGEGLVAVLRGNVLGILGLPFDNGGAGAVHPVPRLPFGWLSVPDGKTAGLQPRTDKTIWRCKPAGVVKGGCCWT